MSAIDWLKALERTRGAQQESGNNLDPREIYKRRARRLATLPDQVGSGLAEVAHQALDADRLEVLVFRPEGVAAGSRYAVPAGIVAEVLHGVQLAPVPGAPPSVRGVIQVRGEIWPLFAIPDVTPDPAVPAAPHAILIRARGNRQVGLLAHELEETRVIQRSAMRPAASEHILGLLPDLTVVLQVESIGAANGASSLGK